MTVREEIDALQLFDHHCHGVVKDTLTWTYFTSLLTEADAAIPKHELDTQLGAFVLRECAQALDLSPFAQPDEYWQRREELGNVTASQTLISASGIHEFGMDTGYRGEELTTPKEFHALTGLPVAVISRLETMAEDLISRCAAEDFPDSYRQLLEDVAPTSIGFKSIIAYRFGLDFTPQRPRDSEVIDECRRWKSDIEQSGNVRLSREVVLRFLLWSAVDIGKPIQMHVGYGDTDINLFRCDPSRMTEFLRLTHDIGTPIVLLHCYPYIRQAAILCQVFSHIWMDTSLAVAHAGYASGALIREAFEMAPFSRLLFASDAFGLAEIYLAGSRLWRRGVTAIAQEWVDEEVMTRARAMDIVTRIGRSNGVNLYGLSEGNYVH